MKKSANCPGSFPLLQPKKADLKMSIHAMPVETPTRRIMVDTCLGNDKPGHNVPTWNNI